MLILAYLGGILTIVSPCILPVLPFVFARSDRSFLRRSVPLLLGMAVTFAIVAAAAAVGGAWVVRANEYGRIAAMIFLAVFAITLLFSRVAEWLARPFVRMGNRLAPSTASGSGVARSFVLGIATGLLWAPCAGPILGLILTAAAINGANTHTLLLLFAYAGGAVSSLAVVLFAGGRVFAWLKRSLSAELWIRRGLGTAILVGVCAIALGADRGILTRISLGSSSTSLEQNLVARLHPRAPLVADPPKFTPAHFNPKVLARLSGAVAWINSPPLTPHDLEGKVVLVDFWTYSCINCLRTLPYIRAWYAKYKDDGFVVVGVHTPEFPFERELSNVRRAVHDLKIAYPVAVDSDHKIWNAFRNEYWPADYLIDSNGRIRHHHFGEGDYDGTEKEIQKLLKQRNQTIPAGYVDVHGKGVQAAPDFKDLQSPETYIGYARAQNFADSAGLKRNVSHTYKAPRRLALNQWALAGNWTDKPQVAILNRSPGSIVFAFHARDLQLVLGPSAGGAPIRFRVTIDGHAPGVNHGVDVNAQGYGAVTNQRLYQLIRQKDKVKSRIFTIEFLDPGVQAYSFTFG
ncbi:MAG TPA: cytochrome c biogenesis protein DipZ [Bryobacteraceae bacterium]